MTGKTGERVVIGGIYKCQEHPEATKTFIKGTVFCPAVEQAVTEPPEFW